MNTGLFDVLHDAADDHVFSIRERVHVYLDCVFEEVIDQNWPILRVLDCLPHVADDSFLVVGNHHGASAEHIRRPHQYWILNSLGALDGFFNRSRHRARRLRDLKLIKQLAETLAIFGQINRLRRRADDVHACGF